MTRRSIERSIASRGLFAATVAEEFDEWGQVTSEYRLFTVAAARVYAWMAEHGAPNWQEGAILFARKHQVYLGLKSIGKLLGGYDDDRATTAQRRHLLSQIANALGSCPDTGPAGGLALRLDFLCDLLDLDPASRAVLGIAARYRRFSIWARLFDDVYSYRGEDKPQFVGILAGIGPNECRRAIAPSGALRSKGLLESRTDANDLDISAFVQTFLDGTATAEGQMFRALMPALPRSGLSLSDYSHLSRGVDRAERLLAHAVETGTRANLLLYGPPGTGKTELSRLLADRLGIPAVSIGQADDDGQEPNRHERLLHLTLSRRLVERRNRALLVIDEAEDLFLAGVEARGSKIWLNKLVEDGVGPHVWIVNDPDMLGEPIVRRMDMAIRFDLPSASTRRAIVERVAERHNLQFAGDPAKAREHLARLAVLETSPAILSTAMQTCARVGEGAEAAFGFARDLAEASGNFKRLPQRNHTTFDPALSVADWDLVALTESLAAANSNWSLLLSGPPGTGKSAFARHVADRLACDLVCRSGADLLGMFVGETEKHIARAFAEAEHKNAVLLIDEADSFLANRDTAQRNWEVSMTNEMLLQMEASRVRFIATTNRAATLDPASARRFTLQAEFVALDPDRARRLYWKTFGESAPAELDRLWGLTPGDFAQVAQRAKLLGETRHFIITKWLSAAVEARGGNATSIGFRAA